VNLSDLLFCHLTPLSIVALPHWWKDRRKLNFFGIFFSLGNLFLTDNEFEMHFVDQQSFANFHSIQKMYKIVAAKSMLCWSITYNRFLKEFWCFIVVWLFCPQVSCLVDWVSCNGKDVTKEWEIAFEDKWHNFRCSHVFLEISSLFRIFSFGFNLKMLQAKMLECWKWNWVSKKVKKEK
jgi:hypothetical protein